MATTEQPKSVWVAYGVPVARIVLALIATPVLLLAWWIGQGCVDDPCEISRSEEIRGIVTILVVGGLFLRAASGRYWPARWGLWLLSGLIGYFVVEPAAQVPGQPIISVAPHIAAAGNVLLTIYVPVVFLTLLLELSAVRKGRA